MGIVQFFKKVLKNIKESARNCIFIDDTLAKVESAKSVGIEAILYDRSQNTLKNILQSNIDKL